MSKMLKINKSTEEGIKELLKFLLENNKVKGVMSLMRDADDPKLMKYSFITDAEVIDNTAPLFPLMPRNAGELVSAFSIKGPLDDMVAVVLKPCELRGFIELVKREQGSFENMLVISHTCGGVLPMDTLVADAIDDELPGYWSAVKGNDIYDGIRPTCKSCIHFEPYMADITVDLTGNADIDKEFTVILNTDKGENAVDGLDGTAGDGELAQGALKSLLESRQAAREELFAEINEKIFGLNNLIEIFGRCIGCHGCSSICPICYCTLCDFESKEHEFEPSAYEAEMDKRGGVRVPPNTVLYHIGRLTHMGISCVECGSCADVCPVEIPVSTVFSKIGSDIQQLFEYIPGKDLEEELPLSKYEEEELEEIEE